MKKIFAMMALGTILLSSAHAIPECMKYVYPEYTGSVTNPEVKVVEVKNDGMFVTVNGQLYWVKTSN